MLCLPQKSMKHADVLLEAISSEQWGAVGAAKCSDSCAVASCGQHVVPQGSSPDGHPGSGFLAAPATWLVTRSGPRGTSSKAAHRILFRTS